MGGNVNVNNLSSEYVPSKNLDGTSVSDRSVTVSNTAINLINTTTLDDNTKYVNFDVQDADIFYTLDGSDPIGGSNGHKIKKDSSAIWNRDMAEAARIIRAGSTDARVHVSELQRK
jgi:hypothetical protein